MTVVWARDTEDEQVKGFLVEGDNPGFTATTMTGKGASRAIWQADITLEGVRVPEEMRLPEAASFKQTGAVLMSTRTTCAWSALGHAVAAYDAALTYAGQREQFGKPLVGFQLIQDRLVRMLSEVTAMQLYCMQLARLEDAGRLTPTIAGLAKLHNTRKARDGDRRGARPDGRQRAAAGEPRDPPHGRHRGHPHLRGHRDDAVADRGPGHHRRGGLRLTRLSSENRLASQPGAIFRQNGRTHLPIREDVPTNG